MCQKRNNYTHGYYEVFFCHLPLRLLILFLLVIVEVCHMNSEWWFDLFMIDFEVEKKPIPEFE